MLRREDQTRYAERAELERELRLRTSGRAGDVVARALVHSAFGTQVAIVPCITVRIPDPDWIEPDRVAQDLVASVHRALDDCPGQVVLHGHTYYVERRGDRFDLRPYAVGDVAAWAVLLHLAAPDLHDVRALLRALDPLLALLHTYDSFEDEE